MDHYCNASLGCKSLLKVVFTACIILLLCPGHLCKPPHIILIVADDMGWNDIGYHNPDIKTPNLNKLAKRGVILESSYMQPICTPSRASILTGYFPMRMGLQHKSIRPPSAKHVPRNVSTMAELLKTRGYQTHMVGKWHLGFCNWQYTPVRRGFDSFFGYLYGSSDYYIPQASAEFYPEFQASSWLTSGPLSLISTSLRMTSKVVRKGYDFRVNETYYEHTVGKYATELLAERAVDTIRQHDQRHPLFLYLAFKSPHGPLQVPLRYMRRCRLKNSKARRIYCGMVAALDEGVGNVTKALRQTGMMDNTLLVFTSDNGAAVYVGGNNLPLRGAKTTLWEGGTRAPAFVYSPTLLHKRGYKHNGLFHAVDWLPTLAHVAGVSVDKMRGIDGMNQWPMISRGENSARTDFVYNIDDKEGAAIRVGDWKLITGSPGVYNKWYPIMGDHVTDTEYNMDTTTKNSTYMLFNIKDDPEERFDHYQLQPNVATRLMEKLMQYRKLMIPAQPSIPHPKADPTLTNGIWTPGWC